MGSSYYLIWFLCIISATISLSAIFSTSGFIFTSRSLTKLLNSMRHNNDKMKLQGKIVLICQLLFKTLVKLVYKLF